LVRATVHRTNLQVIKFPAREEAQRKKKLPKASSRKCGPMILMI
jgi:hypothetical protein